MFSKAVSKVKNFISPVVISYRCYNGTVNSGGGTIVIVNKEGWFISAAHIFRLIPISKQHAIEIANYEIEVAKLKAQKPKASRRELKRLR
jgi:hypothetical protein